MKGLEGALIAGLAYDADTQKPAGLGDQRGHTAVLCHIVQAFQGEDEMSPLHIAADFCFNLFKALSGMDELPELFNILNGDMSVVGPRPLLVKYLPLYNKHQARRHEVRPGFTGYAQVHGRNAISWEEKFDLDVEYVDHVSFLGDWKIIFQTVKTVLKREGISSETAATMEEFKGSAEER